jgi:hypothetical protein
VRTALALLAAAILCACGSSGPTALNHAAQSASPTVPANPCAYVTAADVGAAVGGRVDDGHVSTANGEWNDAPTCVFSPQGSFVVAVPGSNAVFQNANVAFLDVATYDMLTAPPTPFGSSHRVSGYGDEAFEVTGPHEQTLFVRKGAYRLGFVVEAGFASFFLPEERLARSVLARLAA